MPTPPGRAGRVDNTTPLALLGVLRTLAWDQGTALCARAQFRAGPSYHRERIHADRELEVWLLGWLPAQATPIHDHGGAMTASAVLSGSLREERFVRHGALDARVVWAAVHGPGALVPIDAAAIHRVRPLERTITLHAYAPGCTDGQIYREVA